MADDGSHARHPFTSAEECDEIMVQNWNKTVGKYDRIYHLGDVAIKRDGLKILDRLNGKKILIRGNHDIYDLKDYAKYFEDIRGTHKIDSYILSHYPIHRKHVPKWCAKVLHGHTHLRLVKTGGIFGLMQKPDKLYMNLCVEHTNYTPVSYDDIVAAV
jgi:calcineurin-like phosphoesterase family protein